MQFRDPFHGFTIKRIGNGVEGYFELAPQKQSIRLPKSYTASRTGLGTWFVTGMFGKEIKRGSSLHARISACCEFQYSGREQRAADHR